MFHEVFIHFLRGFWDFFHQQHVTFSRCYPAAQLRWPRCRMSFSTSFASIGSTSASQEIHNFRKPIGSSRMEPVDLRKFSWYVMYGNLVGKYHQSHRSYVEMSSWICILNVERGVGFDFQRMETHSSTSKQIKQKGSWEALITPLKTKMTLENHHFQ